MSGRGAFGAWGLGGFGGGVAVPGFARAGRGPPRFAPVSAPLIPAKAPQAPSPKNYPGTLTARAGRSPPRKRAFWARCPPKKAALIPRHALRPGGTEPAKKARLLGALPPKPPSPQGGYRCKQAKPQTQAPSPQGDYRCKQAEPNPQTPSPKPQAPSPKPQAPSPKP